LGHTHHRRIRSITSKKIAKITIGAWPSRSFQV
jgi:UDP-2,3-diacylglucosamine pyrophosphatase LpxH